MTIRFPELVVEIRAPIERGDYPPGKRLFRDDFTKKYRVKRHAVDRVLTALRNEGLVVTVPFKGTFVAPQPVRLVYVRTDAVADPGERPGMGRWEAMCVAQNRDGRADSVTIDRVNATEDLARRLDVEVGTELLRRSRRMLLGLATVQIQDSWMPSDLVDGTPLAEPEDMDDWVYTVMREWGLTHHRVRRSHRPTSD